MTPWSQNKPIPIGLKSNLTCKQHYFSCKNISRTGHRLHCFALKSDWLIIRYAVVMIQRNNFGEIKAPSIIRQKNLKKRLVLPSTRKQSYSKTLFKPEKFKNAGFTFLCGRKTLWKRSFHGDVTIITWFPCPSFPQTQIQHDRWLLRF